MNKNNLKISKIETYLNSILDGVVSSNTFFTALPDASIIKSSDWQDMVLVDFPMGIKDIEAFGRGEVDVVLYARPLASGRKNVAKMSQLEDKLFQVIENASNENYFLKYTDAHSMYDTDINWHCNVITLNILIV
jgi:hypothetical protein